MQRAAFLLAFLITIPACGDTGSVSTPPDPPTTPVEDPPNTPVEDPPAWVWVGPQEEAPACPGDHQAEWEGWAYEPATGECGACACSPAACVLPTMVTAHGTLCTDETYDEGVPVTFDAGQGLDEACVTTSPNVPADDFRSVVYGPPSLAPCTPSQPLEPPPISRSLVRACPSNQDEEPPASFIPCIAPEADGSCQPGFSERMEFAERLVDNRTCEPCACGLPTGGNCRFDVHLYGNAACTSQLDTGFRIGLGSTPCHDTPAPLPLSAVRVVPREQEPGACTPTPRISEVLGTVEQDRKRVFCCSSKD